jgi:hypothetical protein
MMCLRAGVFAVLSRFSAPLSGPAALSRTAGPHLEGQVRCAHTAFMRAALARAVADAAAERARKIAETSLATPPHAEAAWQALEAAVSVLVYFKAHVAGGQCLLALSGAPGEEHFVFDPYAAPPPVLIERGGAGGERRAVSPIQAWESAAPFVLRFIDALSGLSSAWDGPGQHIRLYDADSPKCAVAPDTKKTGADSVAVEPTEVSPQGARAPLFGAAEKPLGPSEPVPQTEPARVASVGPSGERSASEKPPSEPLPRPDNLAV